MEGPALLRRNTMGCKKEVATLIITKSKNFRQLIRQRNKLTGILTILSLGTYYGFIYLVAFQREWMSQPVGSGHISWSIALGISVIVITVLITGIYVWIANSKFDHLTEKLQNGEHE